MVAIIKTGKSLSRILNYNEHKVKEGVADGLGAFNYLLDFDKMGFSQKLNRLTRQAALNEKVTANSFHVSLNFDKTDKLDKGKLLAIAEKYMTMIGFKDQPYLIYQHRDAGHPHIHILSVRVRADGSRIDVHNVGRNESETARKVIEYEFGLVKAQRKRLMKEEPLRPAQAAAAEYGKKETKEAITTVLNAVLPQFNYTSLPELNAVLGLFNVVADRGQKGSRVYENGGLTYRILDKAGRSKGVPIKASDFSFRPILKNLESRFEANLKKRGILTANLKSVINQELASGNSKTPKELIEALKKHNIMVVARIAKTGQTYGLTYVDLKNKIVCNGSELGREYSAAGITAQLNPVPERIYKGQSLSNQRSLAWLLEALEHLLVPTLGIAADVLGEVLKPLESNMYSFELDPIRQFKKNKKRERRL